MTKDVSSAALEGLAAYCPHSPAFTNELARHHKDAGADPDPNRASHGISTASLCRIRSNELTATGH
jgi:hypothetical protein